jgi:hypothetical protein
VIDTRPSVEVWREGVSDFAEDHGGPGSSEQLMGQERMRLQPSRARTLCLLEQDKAGTGARGRGDCGHEILSIGRNPAERMQSGDRSTARQLRCYAGWRAGECVQPGVDAP